MPLRLSQWRRWSLPTRSALHSVASRRDPGATKVLKRTFPGTARSASPRRCSPTRGRPRKTASRWPWSSGRSSPFSMVTEDEPMKFEQPAGPNPIDKLLIVGAPIDRIDGQLKTTGTAKYAYERQTAVDNPAYGFVVGAAIAKGRIRAIDDKSARGAS